MNFWQKLEKPIVGLAPMDGVTDAIYRFMQAKYGKPDVVFTEFIPVEGIVRISPGLLKDFWYSEVERPVLAQIYGNDPKLFYAATQLVCELGFDGVDINMGCPAKSVVHRGCGAALINTPELAKDLINAAQTAVADWRQNGVDWGKWPVLEGKKAERLFREFVDKSRRLGFYSRVALQDGKRIDEANRNRVIPVSVKTRIGFRENVIESWIANLLETKPAAITVHGRTLKQQYTGLADWDAIGMAVKVRDSVSSETLILGNGDIKTALDAKQKISQSGVDGVLIGRGTFGNPFIFRDVKTSNFEKNSFSELILEHAKLHEKLKPDQFVQVRKNLAWYISNMPHAAELRSKLVRVNSVSDVETILAEFKN